MNDNSNTDNLWNLNLNTWNITEFTPEQSNKIYRFLAARDEVAHEYDFDGWQFTLSATPCAKNFEITAIKKMGAHTEYRHRYFRNFFVRIAVKNGEVINRSAYFWQKNLETSSEPVYDVNQTVISSDDWHTTIKALAQSINPTGNHLGITKCGCSGMQRHYWIFQGDRIPIEDEDAITYLDTHIGQIILSADGNLPVVELVGRLEDGYYWQ